MGQGSLYRIAMTKVECCLEVALARLLDKRSMEEMASRS
jgi:hypothetical protein